MWPGPFRFVPYRPAQPKSDARGAVMIHHVSLGANDIAGARAFYDPIMALLGFRL